jgi:hypothetical protein
MEDNRPDFSQLKLSLSTNLYTGVNIIQRAVLVVGEE